MGKMGPACMQLVVASSDIVFAEQQLVVSSNYAATTGDNMHVNTGLQ